MSSSAPLYTIDGVARHRPYFIEGFPKVGGKSVVLTIIDRFSKYVHFIALGTPTRRCLFPSVFWTTLFKLVGVELHLSSAFHPQTGGQSKVTNRILGMYLRCLARDQPRR